MGDSGRFTARSTAARTLVASARSHTTYAAVPPAARRPNESGQRMQVSVDSTSRSLGGGMSASLGSTKAPPGLLA
ncbi:hypothetical protein ACFWA5_22555 [Streptomyces mirabilis]|uniref:hypothetical protein n=1 Tax=Streptomyces mirabilis TaxID=68239 RepID=UPI0036506400